ncbi:hypothetical protein A2W57_00710 [Candidatus Giovannonibacteria bacterium RIFCSPHIGHO2_02_43_16]|uniref:Abasic site processing protein n=1 Tax=Candidatus Giovannonibacteria bacterium RIFCSPHIGHO2_02_43_16 TaxID=1798331 RepID=A0A1F5WFA1_9BACT|nr:MAG: hypothetical protein A2W57_00710 [Candidatus Giovannonibacteria bacterium RIFCSPHIGHO2_02_43_16]
MCGRFSIGTSQEMLEDYFDAKFEETFKPNYNAAPSQSLPVILNKDPLHIILAPWGIKPVWLEHSNIKRKDGLINIRAETLKEKATFKKDLKERRCLVISDGYYEWKKTDKGKIPYRFILKKQMPFAFAGLWEQNEGEERFAVITTTPNKMAVKVHHRMPVILNMKEKDAWLDADLDPIKALKMLDPYPEKEMEYFEVSKTLNSARFNDIRLTQKISNSQNIIDKSKNF